MPQAPRVEIPVLIYLKKAPYSALVNAAGGTRYIGKFVESLVGAYLDNLINRKANTTQIPITKS